MKALQNNIKLTFAIVTGLLIVGAALIASPLLVDAQSAKDAACEGVALTGGSCDGAGAETTVNSTIKTVINILSIVVGFIAVIMVIVGGLKYVISSGDSSNVNSAKNTILYAIVGLVIVALAQVIVRFVLNRVG